MTTHLYRYLRLFSFFSFLLLTSCWFVGDIDDEEVADLDKDLYASKRKTMLDKSLIDFGRMLEAYDVPPTPIQSKNIGNETAAKEVPTDIYTMIATSINKIGKSVVFVPYDVQYIVDEETTGGNIQRLYPEAVVSGGITGFDKDMVEKERAGEVEGGWSGASGGAKYDAGGGVSRVTLDLNMLDYRSQSYYPGVLATNSLLIRKDKFGWGVKASYQEFAVSFDYELKTKQGLYAAIRYLVELSILELFGKYFNVPYWKCIKGASPDTNMLARLEDNFASLDKKVQILYIKKFLFLHGYKDIDRTKDTFSAEEQHEVNEAMQKYGVNTYTNLFMSLWDTVPMNKSRLIIRQDKIRKKREEKLRLERQRRESEKQAAIQKKLQEEKRKKMLEDKKNAEENYRIAISQGNKAFSKEDYSKATEYYTTALKAKPNDKYAGDMLKKSNALLKQIKELETKYNHAVIKGDEYFRKKEYSKAIKEYKQALSIKSNEKYPADRLKEAEKINRHKNPLGVGSLSEDAWNDDGY